MTIDQLPLEDRYGFHVFTGSDCARFEPKLITDEYWSVTEQRWNAVSHHAGFIRPHIYRRRICAGEGFEIVPLDEAICEGYEITYSGKSWDTWGAETAHSVRDNFKRFPNSEILAFRRRIKSAPKVESGWIAVKDRLPLKACKLLVWSDKAPESLPFRSSFDGFKFTANPPPTHWMPLPTPPQLPKPEPSADEVAFEKVMEELEQDRIKNYPTWKYDAKVTRKRARMIFDFTLAHARKEGGK